MPRLDHLRRTLTVSAVSEVLGRGVKEVINRPEHEVARPEHEVAARMLAWSFSAGRTVVATGPTWDRDRCTIWPQYV